MLTKFISIIENIYILLKSISIKTEDAGLLLHSIPLQENKLMTKQKDISTSIKLQFRNILEHAITRIYASSGSSV